MILDPDARHFTRLMKPDFGLGLGLGQPSGGHIVPALDLSFINGETLDSRITFSRASAATRVNSSGLIETVASGTARFDYDPVTLAAKGLLIEEQRTNLLVRSAEFDHASWSKGGTSVTANATVSPDGNANADIIVEDIGAGSHRTNQTALVSNGIAYFYSIYLKAAERGWALVEAASGATNVYIYVNLLTGEKGNGSSSAIVINAGNGWWRVTIPITAAATTMACYVFSTTGNGVSSYTGDGSSGIYAWGAQLEAGAFSSSYIPTAGSQVTRALDLANITGASFSSFFNNAEGTFIANFELLSTTSDLGRAVFAANGGSSANRLYAVISAPNTSRAIVSVSSVIQADLISSLVTSGPSKIALAYAANDFAMVVAGGAAATDKAGSVPAVGQLDIGNQAGATQLYGHIRSLRYYRSRLPDSILRCLTA